MRSQRTWVRVAVPAAAALAASALAVLSSPAGYAEETPSPKPSTTPEPTASPEDTTPPGSQPTTHPAATDMAVRIATDKVAVDSKGKLMRVDVLNAGPETAKHVTLTIDLSKLGDQVELKVHEDPACQTRGRTITCAYDAIRAGGTRVAAFKVKPRAGAKPGDAGTVKATVSAKNSLDSDRGNNTDSAAISIVDSAIDLVAAVEDIGPVKPGGTTVLKWAFGNHGDTAAKGISLKATLPPYATFTDTYRDCTTSKNRRELVCTAKDVVISPGDEIYWNSPGVEPVHVKVAPDAPGPISLGMGSFVAASIGEVSPQPVEGSGAEMMATKSGRAKPSEVDGDDNSAGFAVLTKENPADLAVSANKASGQVGDVVKVTLSVRNNGPADANGFHATVAVPKGTKLTKVPRACSYHADKRTLHCKAGDMLDKGRTAKQDLLLRITSDKLENGSAKVATNVIPDRKKGNNSTPVNVTIGTGGSGGGLPVTGVSLTAVIAGGALAVLLGGVLFLVARRRRPS
ncbi:MAG: hypothetical protein ACRDUA_03045, partial [Micromonosporaceae bacterium]